MAPWRPLALFSALLSQSQRSAAWFDEGHALVGAIATDHVLPEYKDKYVKLLRCDGGNSKWANFSDLSSAAVWMDHIRCVPPLGGEQPPPFCRGTEQMSAIVDNFGAWHAAIQSYKLDDVDEATLDLTFRTLDLSRPPDSYFNANGLTMLNDVGNTFSKSPTDLWSWAFGLRLVLHIFGDLHQPLHAVMMYSKQCTDGDWSGHKVATFVDGVPLLNDLHTLWDAAAGRMMKTLPVDDAVAFKARVAQIQKKYPPSFFKSSSKLSENWNEDKADQSYGIRHTREAVNDFNWRMIRDTFTLAPEAYAEFKTFASSGNYVCKTAWQMTAEEAEKFPRYTPSPRYLQMVGETCEKQIALAGYRLASWLNYHGRYLPAEVTCPVPAEVTCPAPQPGGFGFLSVALAFAGGAALAAAACCAFVSSAPRRRPGLERGRSSVASGIELQEL